MSVVGPRNRDQDQGPTTDNRRPTTFSKAFVLENFSGYDDADLRRFLGAACRASGIYPERFVVVASPIRSRGCSQIPSPRPAGSRSPAAVVVAVAPPSRFTVRRLARLLDHELLHASGLEHEEMSFTDKYSTGPTPAWAEGLSLRHRGRAPVQIPR